MSERTGPPAPGETIDIPPCGAVLLDTLGAVAIRVEPENDLGLLVELGGRLNKSDVRRTTGFLVTAAHAAELIANIVVAVQHLRAAGDPAALAFNDELERALERERERLGAVEGEHG